MKKTAISLRRTLALLTIGAAGAVFGFTGLAHGAATQSYQISPPVSNYNANPGQTVKGTMKVTNLSDQPLPVKVGKENFVAKGEEGEIELTDDANPLYSLAPWFSFDTPALDLPPRATKELHYTIAVPAGAEPGGRYASITYNSIPPKLAPGQSGAAVQQTLAGIVFLRINGAAKEDLSIVSFGPEHPYYEAGPVRFLTRVKNDGTVHEKPAGTITIKNLFGWKVSEVKLDEHFVIPGAIRRLHNSWPSGHDHPFMFGPYTAQLDATYAGGKHLTATASFSIIPWKPVALGLIMLLVLVVFFWRTRRRFARAARILAGKE